jgi:hypothetical protein
MAKTTRTTLRQIVLTGGPESATLDSGVLAVTTDDSGWKEWEIVTTCPLPLSFAIGTYQLTFAAEGHSGMCFVQRTDGNRSRFQGTGPLTVEL